VPKDSALRDNHKAYRPLHVSSLPAKIISKAIYLRWREREAAIPPEQLRFVQGSAMEEAVCVALAIAHHYRREGVFLTLVDVQQAFDRVHRGKLFTQLEQSALPACHRGRVLRGAEQRAARRLIEPRAFQLLHPRPAGVGPQQPAPPGHVGGAADRLPAVGGRHP